MTNKKQASHNEPEPQEFGITYHPVKQGVYNIYLFGVIESAQQFIGAIEVLATAGPDDTVVVHLSTDGGSLEATDTFIQSIRETEAHVVAKISGGCHSAGTLIALAVDEFQLSENASFLFHNGSCGSGGKFSDFVAHTEHTKKYFEKVMRTSYSGFLEPHEIEELLKGVDRWMDSEEFVTRHNKRNEFFLSQYEEAQAAEQAALEAIQQEHSPKPARAQRKPLTLGKQNAVQGPTK